VHKRRREGAAGRHLGGQRGDKKGQREPLTRPVWQARSARGGKQGGVAGRDGMISPRVDRRPREKTLQWLEKGQETIGGAQRAWYMGKVQEDADIIATGIQIRLSFLLVLSPYDRHTHRHTHTHTKTHTHKHTHKHTPMQVSSSIRIPLSRLSLSRMGRAKS
jgi:ABC-type nickel/cobalt efflux system permease component RcnA